MGSKKQQEKLVEEKENFFSWKKKALQKKAIKSLILACNTLGASCWREKGIPGEATSVRYHKGFVFLLVVEMNCWLRTELALEKSVLNYPTSLQE